jgi:hypothetical protein
MEVSSEQLGAWLGIHQGGSRICAVTMLCPVKMNKYGASREDRNPFIGPDGESQVDHLSERIVIAGADYAKMVNKSWEALPADSEGFIPTFQAEALWKGKGRKVNSYLVEHTDKHTLYMELFFTRLKVEGAEWVEKSLKGSAFLHRFTGLPVDPAEFAPYLPPKRQASAKQGCQEDHDLAIEMEGSTYTIRGGEVGREVMVRLPHLDNILQIRSFDLQRRGHYDIIVLRRTKFQISV